VAVREEPLSASRHSPDWVAQRMVGGGIPLLCNGSVARPDLHAVPAVVPPLRASGKGCRLDGLVVGQRPRLRGGAVAGVQLLAGAGDRVTVGDVHALAADTVICRTGCRQRGDLAAIWYGSPLGVTG